MKVLDKLYEKLGLGRSILRDERGQTLIEYVLVIGLISIVFLLAYQTAMMDNLVMKTGEYIANAVSIALSPP